MSAFNDAQKLADAIALARSFKSGESSDKKGKKRGRVASPASTQGMIVHPIPSIYNLRTSIQAILAA